MLHLKCAILRGISTHLLFERVVCLWEILLVKSSSNQPFDLACHLGRRQISVATVNVKRGVWRPANWPAHGQQKCTGWERERSPPCSVNTLSWLPGNYTCLFCYRQHRVQCQPRVNKLCRRKTMDLKKKSLNCLWIIKKLTIPTFPKHFEICKLRFT